MRPTQVNAKASKDVHEMLASKVQVKKPKYKSGDIVRMFKYKHVLIKEMPQIGRKLFTIAEVKKKNMTYTLKDENSNISKGGFIRKNC